MTSSDKDRRVTVELSAAQAVAAFVACSNYTPPRNKDWAQRSQAIAARALGMVIRRAGMSKRIRKGRKV